MAIVLVCLGCYGVAYKQQTFISHSLEAGKFKIMATADLVLAESRWFTFYWPELVTCPFPLQGVLLNENRAKCICMLLLFFKSGHM